MKSASIAAIWALIFALCATAPAADAPATQPAAPPYVLVMPPGMQQVTVGEHTVICDAKYSAGARQGLAKLTAATRPTTMPADVLSRLADSRATLLDQMPADMGVTKEAAADFLDNTLKAAMTKLVGAHATVYLVLAPEDQVSAALRSGWNAPLFHYNKLNGRTVYRSEIVFNFDQKPDDVVLWFEVKPGQSDSDRADGVVAILRDFDSQFLRRVSVEGIVQTQSKLITFITDTLIKPLNLPSTEQWFGLGSVQILTAKYLAPLTGYSRQQLTDTAANDSQVNPLLSRSLDIMHAFAESDVRPAYWIYYQNAVGRRGTTVLRKLTDAKGDSILLKIITAMRQAPPPDNATLVQLIHDMSGMDLTNDLLPPQ